MPMIPIIVGPDEGTMIEGPVGGPATIKLRGAQTNGALARYETVAGPGQGPQHLLRWEDEIFCVLDGALRFQLNDEIRIVGEGACVFIRRGTPHSHQNSGDEAARLRVQPSPCAMGVRRYSS